jgi:hypothetical protein
MAFLSSLRKAGDTFIDEKALRKAKFLALSILLRALLHDLDG